MTYGRSNIDRLKRHSGNEVLLLFVLALGDAGRFGHLGGDGVVLEELVHGGRDVIGVLEALLVGNLLVHQVALKDSVGADIEDGDEDGGDHVGQKENDEEREEDGVDFSHGAKKEP